MWRSRTFFASARNVNPFRQGQELRVSHTAPAGPACLNNNAPFRRGRTYPQPSGFRTLLPAHHSRMEASHP